MRHLDPITQSKVSHRLFRLTEKTFLHNVASTAVPSVETINALLILSIWTPPGVAMCADKREERRSLIVVAAKMAVELKLAESVVEFHRCGKKGRMPDHIIDRARLVSHSVFMPMVMLLEHPPNQSSGLH